MEADSNMGFQHGSLPMSVYNQLVSFQSGAMGSSYQMFPARMDRPSTSGMVLGGATDGISNGAVMVRTGSSGNLLLDAVAGSKQEIALAADWTYQEQALLEKGLVRYANHPNISKYIKVAALLPEKTVRDVALRCQWMVKKENGKRQKLEEYYSGTKTCIKKDKAVDRVLQATISHDQPINLAPYSLLTSQKNFCISSEVIDAATSHLLDENITLLSQINANLEILKLEDNVHLLNCARNSIKRILNSLGPMPPLPGSMNEMPPLPVALYEDLADTLLPMSQRASATNCLRFAGIPSVEARNWKLKNGP